MTSLNMPGFSISLVRLPTEDTKVSNYSISSSQLVELLDAEAQAPAWKYTAKREPSVDTLTGKDQETSKAKTKTETKGGPAIADQKIFTDALTAACKAGIAAEPELTRYDSILGDGDCGLTLKAGCEGKQDFVDSVFR